MRRNVPVISRNHGLYRGFIEGAAIRWPAAIVLASVAAVVFFSLPFSGRLRAEPLSSAAAETLRLTGKYEEALEAFRALVAQNPQNAAAVLGEARCHAARGELAEAEKKLLAGIEREPGAPNLIAELAALAIERGDIAAAQAHVDKVLSLDPRHVPARWLNAELHRISGRTGEARAGYEWLVDHHNAQAEITDPTALHAVGRAAAQFARWSRNPSQFHFLVNTFYPKVLAKHREFWPARLEMGLLFLEKYNLPAAAAEFDAALALNPRAAEAHVARAQLALEKYDLAAADLSLQRAFEINPRLVWAMQVQADRHVADFRPDLALPVLERALAANPAEAATRGRRAAVFGLIDGLASDQPSARLEREIALAIAENPHCGEFFLALASVLDQARKFPAAARYYREALDRMPELTNVRGKLGLMFMRLGDEAAARPLLEESFRVDPFNVRVKNTLAVLAVLENYAVLETEHFVLKFDRGADALLARYAAEYLEQNVYPSLVAKLGYAPKEKPLFEIFNRTTATSGHGWFSARMVGLPYVGTVGACAGRMVAMVSPGDMPRKFNWARVLRHEFVHVVNLQQTHFNVPHWFTEALAVWHENGPRPAEWLEILAERHAADRLFTLDTIHHGFIRPASSRDWALAYCQAELYVEYLCERFGEQAPAKLLAAYADHLATPAALQRALGIEQAELERGYRDFVARVLENERGGAAGWAEPNGNPSSPQRTLAQWHEELARNPQNAELNARVAFEHLQRSTPAEARKYATAALEQNARSGLAGFVLARLLLAEQQPAVAIKTLQDSLDEARPNASALALLASLVQKQGDTKAAARYYELGARKFPAHSLWPKALARLYLQTGETGPLAAALQRLAELDADDPLPRKKLSRLNLAAGNAAAAARWARETLYIDVLDAEAHCDLGQAHLAFKEFEKAIFEFETALSLGGEDPDWRLLLANAQHAAGNVPQAKATLRNLLERAPDHAAAKARLAEIEAKP